MQKANKIILVIKDKLILYNRTNNRWKKGIETYCYYGKNGYSKIRVEGDKTTPIGIFPLLYAFGIEDNVETKLEYRKITDKSYFSIENKWIESDVPVKGEHLIEYTKEYKYGIVIGFNVNPYIEGKGSAIFLHCKGEKDYTAGCIAVDEKVMKYLIKTIEKGTYIVLTKLC